MTTKTFPRTSPRGHRADPFTYPIHLGGYQSHAHACAECGYDLEPEARGRFRHLARRDGAQWLERNAR